MQQALAPPPAGRLRWLYTQARTSLPLPRCGPGLGPSSRAQSQAGATGWPRPGRGGTRALPPAWPASGPQSSRGLSPHQRKSESWHGHAWAVSAAVKFLPLTHHAVAFLFRKLLRWPMRQPSPCSGSVGWGWSPFPGGDTEAQEGRGVSAGQLGRLLPLPPTAPCDRGKLGARGRWSGRASRRKCRSSSIWAGGDTGLLETGGAPLSSSGPRAAGPVQALEPATAGRAHVDAQ